MEWMYTLYKFHFLNGISEIINFWWYSNYMTSTCILPLLCNQNENYHCWSSMIMSSYFNVQYLHQKNDKDLCWYRPKPHFARGVSKLLEDSVYIYIYIYIYEIYTTIQKFLNSKIFYYFFNGVSSAHQPCIYLIPNTAKAVHCEIFFTI